MVVYYLRWKDGIQLELLMLESQNKKFSKKKNSLHVVLVYSSLSSQKKKKKVYSSLNT